MSRKYKYTPPEECKQAVIFIRVSSNKQELGASIEAQIEAVDNYCKKKDLLILEPKRFVITESSTRGDRKLFHEMLDFVRKQKRKTAIVVHCIDRLQRGFDECSAIRQLLKDDKAEIHFYKEGLILHKESPSSDMMRYEMGILSAKMYLGSMQDNVKRSQKYNRSIGKWQGLAPIGYLNAKDDEKKSTLVIDPVRGPIIVKLFKAYAAGGHSLKSIWHYAIELGLLSKEPNHFKKSKNYKKYVPVSRNTVQNILKNPFYHGIMYAEGLPISHVYQPLISKSLFDRAQEASDERKKAHCHEQVYGNTPLALRGLIHCSTCGCLMTPEPHRKNGKEYIYLRCSHVKGGCNQGLVNENIVFEQLDNEIFKNLRVSGSLLELIKKNVHKYLDDESELNASVRKRVSDDIKVLEARKERLWDYLLDGTIDKAKYELEKAKIETQINELQKTADKYVVISKELKEIVENVIDVAAKAPLLMRLANPLEKNELLRLLLSDCVLEDKELRYTIKKPFDKLVRCTDYKNWKNISLENLEEFSALASNIKQFRESIKQANVLTL